MIPRAAARELIETHDRVPHVDERRREFPRLIESVILEPLLQLDFVVRTLESSEL